ncbi:hypothetical protein [Streptomyces sp. NPDC058307]|uniref:hypothetical protein n=1 Tax=Streptomyces sp. NPDC058307 TaxID=3346439 RepID=UPI0036EFF8FF
MSTLEFTVLGLDFPVGSTNKITTLTGEREVMLVNARPHPRTRPARRQDPQSSKKLTTLFVSHGRRGEMAWG